MSETILYKHSFNAGDLVTVMPGMQELYKQTGKKAKIFQRLDLPADYSHNDNHPIKDESGRLVCMNKAMFSMLKPLIEAQEYVESFEVWEGHEVQFDFDLTRQNSQMPMPGGSIHNWPVLIFPQLACDLSAKWIYAGNDYLGEVKRIIMEIHGIESNDYIILNFTERYRNPYITYHFLKQHEKVLIFAGTKYERDLFCEKNNLSIPLLFENDFLFLAKSIKGAKFFLGNQSMCWHVSDAMKKPRILEVCSSYPNTFPTGANGYAFITQGALEFYFDKLMNQ